MVRGRRLLADGVAVAAWAGGLAAADGAAAALAHPGAQTVSPHGGLAGPALAAALAVGLRWARGPDAPRLGLAGDSAPDH
jgi:hypothetical protein